jgi:hypothetical protein
MGLPRGESAVVYALGGGLGHLTRALLVARGFARATVLHASPVRPALATHATLVRVEHGDVTDHLRDADTLVVDTFPAGVARELSDKILRPFARTVLLRRYIRPGAYEDDEALAARFDAVLLPYPADDCEWEGTADGLHVGHIVRDLSVEDGAEAPLAVLGNAEVLPPAWRALLAPDTVFVAGPFSRLPRAARYLSVGAGYNVCHELARLGVDFRAAPLERRYDDQFRRADRLGVGLYDRDALERWL